MKKLSLCVFFLSAGILILSCGKVKEAANAVEGLRNYAEGVKESASKMEERKAKGNTISIPYKELQKMLPSSISGFTKNGEPSGRSVNMVGISYSMATQAFKSGNGEITINIMDYNASYAAFGMAISMFTSGLSMATAKGRNVEPNAVKEAIKSVDFGKLAGL